MTTIKLRRGTASEWTTSNPVLNDGEVGFERDTNKHKIGDGVTAWNSLKYFINETVISSVIAAQVAAIGLSSVIDTYTLVLTDAGKFIKASKATAFTITVPPVSSVAFPVGTVIGGIQFGAGQVTVAGGVGVTVRAPSGTKTAATGNANPNVVP